MLLKLFKKLWQVLTGITEKSAKGLSLIWTDKDFRLFAIVYFVQGALGLTTVSFPLFLKQELGMTVVAITTMMASYGTLWLIKPLYGAISDALPIFGFRRKPYIMLFSAVSSIAWALVAFYPPSYGLVFFAMFLQSLGFAFTDVVIDGLAVEKSTEKTAGKIQSIMWGSRMAGMMVSGFLGGYLIGVIGYQGIFTIVAMLPCAVIIATMFVKEAKVVISKEKVLNIWSKVKAWLSNLKKPSKVIADLSSKYKALAFASLFIFVSNMFPHFTTGSLAPFTIFMKESLDFSDSLLGLLVTVMSLGKLLGVIIYALFLDGVDLRRVLKWSIIISSMVTLFALLKFNPTSALLIHLCWGVTGYISFLPVMKLAVKSCPKSIEATVFALLMSISNLGSTVATLSSGYVYEYYGLQALIVLAFIGGLLALPFIKYLKGEGE